MLALRYLHVLALVVWLGGMILFGAVVAPTAFEVLQASAPGNGRALAGELVGAMLARFHPIAYGAGTLLLVTLAAMAILGPRPRGFGVRSAIIASMLAVALYSGRAVLPELEALQREIGAPSSSLPQDDPRRLRFEELHVLSTRLMIVNVAAGMVLLYWEARES